MKRTLKYLSFTIISVLFFFKILSTLLYNDKSLLNTNSDNSSKLNDSIPEQIVYLISSECEIVSNNRLKINTSPLIVSCIANNKQLISGGNAIYEQPNIYEITNEPLSFLPTYNYYSESSSNFKTIMPEDKILLYCGDIGDIPKVEYINYFEDSRTPDIIWEDYFRNKLTEKIGLSDSPIIISESYKFFYKNSIYTIVNATNISYSLENYVGYDRYSFNEGVPMGENLCVYYMSACFKDDKLLFEPFEPLIHTISSAKPLEMWHGDNSIVRSFIPNAKIDYCCKHMNIQYSTYSDLSVFAYYDICSSNDQNDTMIKNTFFIGDIDCDTFIEIISFHRDKRGKMFENICSITKIQ